MKINKPKIKPFRSGSWMDMIESEEYYDWIIEGNPPAGFELYDITFDGCRFIKTDFSLLTTDGFDLLDCILEDCDLSNLSLHKHYLLRTEFRKCKLTGTDFSESSWKDISLINCIGQYTSFAKAEIKNCFWSCCKFTESSFHHLIQKDFFLEEVDFTKSDFIHSQLTNLDITRCNIQNILIDSYSLKDLIVNEEQALALAPILGIIIKN